MKDRLYIIIMELGHSYNYVEISCFRKALKSLWEDDGITAYLYKLNPRSFNCILAFHILSEITGGLLYLVMV